MNKKIPFFVLFIILLVFFNAKSEDNGIIIVSDKLNVEMDERKSTFTGNVYAHNENLKLWSDKMIVNLEIDKDEIKEILALGNVKIIRVVEGSEIYGDLANYSIGEEIILITGNVTVKENGNQVSGNELAVDLKNSSSIMSGSDSNRVEAIILDN
jgi:lipopolysaccharide export system protein LptA